MRSDEGISMQNTSDDKKIFYMMSVDFEMFYFEIICNFHYVHSIW